MQDQHYLTQALMEVLPADLSYEALHDAIEKPKYQHLGDWAFPCFILAKTFKQSPTVIAEQLASQMSHSHFNSIVSEGPYINAFVNREQTTASVLQTIFDQGHHYGQNTDDQEQTVVFDLSSPNIAKPFSMGHLRSTVIGNALANIAEKCGYQTVRINYIGDWGTQFGKLMAAYTLWGDEAAVKADPVTELFKLYQQFHKEAEVHPELNDSGRQWFKKLEEGDENAVQLWQWFRQVSLTTFNDIYQKLGIHFDETKGEAYYNDKMDAVVAQLEKQGLLETSDGAKVVDMEDDDLPPCLIKKKDGTTLYATRDLAAALDRYKDHSFSEAYYVVGNEQSLHFRQLQAVLQRLGYPWADDITHISFGMILQDGKKMSTRKGQVTLLEDVLDDIIAKAKANIEGKNPSLPHKENVAKAVGTGALIFHDLKHHRQHDIEFSLNDMLTFQGETGPYLQYTHARLCSLLKKGEFNAHVDGLFNVQQSVDDYLWSVIMYLRQYPDVIKKAHQTYDPSQLAKGLLNLAQAFNNYYGKYKIIGADDQLLKLAVVNAVRMVLADGLALLGIEAPEQM